MPTSTRLSIQSVLSRNTMLFGRLLFIIETPCRRGLTRKFRGPQFLKSERLEILLHSGLTVTCHVLQKYITVMGQNHLSDEWKQIYFYCCIGDYYSLRCLSRAPHLIVCWTGQARDCRFGFQLLWVMFAEATHDLPLMFQEWVSTGYDCQEHG